MGDNPARIRSQLAQFVQLLDSPAAPATDVSVSGWSVAEHIEHCLKVCSAVFSGVLNGSPLDGKKVGWIARIILRTGYIPPGRKAPELVVPTGMSLDELLEKTDQVGVVLGQIEERFSLSDGTALRDRRPIFLHPILGPLTLAHSLRFVEVHNTHHLRIVGNILTKISASTAS